MAVNALDAPVSDEVLEGFLRAPQVAELLGFSLSYVHRLDSRGHLVGFRLGPKYGGMLLFKTADVEAFAASWKRRTRRSAP